MITIELNFTGVPENELIDFENSGVNIYDWFTGDTVNLAANAETPEEADAYLATGYTGRDYDGVGVEWACYEDPAKLEERNNDFEIAVKTECEEWLKPGIDAELYAEKILDEFWGDGVYADANGIRWGSYEISPSDTRDGRPHVISV